MTCEWLVSKMMQMKPGDTFWVDDTLFRSVIWGEFGSAARLALVAYRYDIGVEEGIDGKTIFRCRIRGEESSD